jgi:hypothetical protein
MRIELPSASWADTVHRAEDDAHTLTVAAQPGDEWPLPGLAGEPMLAVRTEVSVAEPVALTITF